MARVASNDVTTITSMQPRSEGAVNANTTAVRRSYVSVAPTASPSIHAELYVHDLIPELKSFCQSCSQQAVDAIPVQPAHHARVVSYHARRPDCRRRETTQLTARAMFPGISLDACPAHLGPRLKRYPTMGTLLGYHGVRAMIYAYLTFAGD